MTALPVLVASDLDATLIYSARSMLLRVPDDQAPSMLCVEVHDRKPVAFMTLAAANAVHRLNELGALMPVTTRTMAQYQRVHLPGPQPEYAVCANGGRLLHRGREDEDYTAEIAATLATSSAPLEEVLEHVTTVAQLGQRAGFVKSYRSAERLFCYIVLHTAQRPDDWFAQLAQPCADLGWEVTSQGRKIYLVPNGLTKADAVAAVAERTGAGTVLAAGDSLLDLSLLTFADAAIRPRHGELHAVGWSRPNVTVTNAEGILGGEEIAAWMLHAVAEAPRGSSRAEVGQEESITTAVHLTGADAFVGAGG